MRLQHRIIMCLAMLLIGLTSAWSAETLTPPPESLNGLRPGTLTVGDLTTKYGNPKTTNKGGLLALYGGTGESTMYGWFMVDNPTYTVPDLAVETAKDSNRIDLVMAIGYDGLKTSKGLACFADEDTMLQTYGKPDFVYSVPMNGFTLREFYFVDQGISFDVAPVGAADGRKVIAIYVTYPEYLKKAISLRKDYINKGTGKDITTDYTEGLPV